MEDLILISCSFSNIGQSDDDQYRPLMGLLRKSVHEGYTSDHEDTEEQKDGEEYVSDYEGTQEGNYDEELAIRGEYVEGIIHST